MTPDQLLDQVRRYAYSVCVHHDSAHDILHCRRVLTNARRISEGERNHGVVIDDLALEIACWLHDVVQLPKGKGEPGEAARRSAIVAADLLRSLRADTALIQRVEHAIAAHSYSGDLTPESIEATILQDADRIDALGAIGIARFWVVASQLGSEFYDEDDPLGLQRPYDDQRYALDHIHTKLLKLPDTMNTKPGRAIAVDRAEYVAQHYEAFMAELGVRE